MQKKPIKPQRTPSEFRGRRARLGLSAEVVGREAGLSMWRVYRLELSPKRARLGDVLLVDATLARLERAVAGGLDFHSALDAAVESGR